MERPARTTQKPTAARRRTVFAPPTESSVVPARTPSQAHRDAEEPVARLAFTSRQILDLISSLLEGREAAEASVLRHKAQGDAARVEAAEEKVARLQALLVQLTDEVRGL